MPISTFETSPGKDALHFLKRYKTGVLTTLSEDGLPNASMVYYICDNHGKIYFTTLPDSRKFANISKNPRIAFTVSTEDVPQTVQIEGNARLIEGHEQKPYLGHLIQTLSANSTYYPPPAMKISSHEMVIFTIEPDWIRWSDFKATDAQVHLLLQRMV